MTKFDKLKIQPISLLIGYDENLTYPETGQKVGEIALIQEVGFVSNGRVKIKPRSFIRTSVEKYGDKWKQDLAKLIIEYKLDPEKALSQLGILAIADIRENIMSIMEPPNAPATIKAKGFDKPLIGKNRLLYNGLISMVVSHEYF